MLKILCGTYLRTGDFFGMQNCRAMIYVLTLVFYMFKKKIRNDKSSMRFSSAVTHASTIVQLHYNRFRCLERNDMSVNKYKEGENRSCGCAQWQCAGITLYWQLHMRHTKLRLYSAVILWLQVCSQLFTEITLRSLPSYTTTFIQFRCSTPSSRSRDRVFALSGGDRAQVAVIQNYASTIHRARRGKKVVAFEKSSYRTPLRLRDYRLYRNID